MKTHLISPRFTALFAVTLCLPLALSPAFAAEQARLNYADLNLTMPAGQAALEMRIKAAARSVCAETERTGARFTNPDCAKQVRSQVLSQISACQNNIGKGG